MMTKRLFSFSLSLKSTEREVSIAVKLEPYQKLIIDQNAWKNAARFCNNDSLVFDVFDLICNTAASISKSIQFICS